MEDSAAREDLKRTIDQFWETVPKVWNLIRGHLRTVAEEQFDISVEQFHLLRVIRKGLTSVSEIAEARQTSRSAVSQAADTLVEKGLITRRQESGDRRFVHLALTPEGQSLLDQIFHQNHEWMMEKMAAADSADLECITTGLMMLKAAFEPPVEKTQEETLLIRDH
jgi:MarR family 2-MHQ and catechol resistance regulon transcriptional repressor